MKNAREAAFLANLKAIQSENFIEDVLKDWSEKVKPSPRDYKLAEIIAYGSLQKSALLDAQLKHLSANGKISVKAKEKILLRTALYQIYFLDRVPAYAVIDETIKVAKKHCNARVTTFINAILRKAAETPLLPLPQDLAIQHSHTSLFISLLKDTYGIEETKTVLNILDQPPCLLARHRSTNKFIAVENLSDIAKSSEYYIQNPTPFLLMSSLLKSSSPKAILDVCASPGGKLLIAHDLFPEATLFGGDLSTQKLQLLQKNCEKYGLQIALKASEGKKLAEIYPQKFDLIILDVPCSNSGVLRKCPEARLRMTKEHFASLERTQKQLIEEAIEVLSPGGNILYMTCSILKEENENLVRDVAKLHGLNLQKEEKIIPSADKDGGYGALLTKS